MKIKKFVWKKNIDAEQTIGNKQILRPLTYYNFKKDILPKLRKQFLKGKTKKEKFEEFRGKFNNLYIEYLYRKWTI